MKIFSVVQTKSRNVIDKKCLFEWTAFNSFSLKQVSFRLSNNCACYYIHRVMFQDRMEVWEEIEAKVNSGNDVPVVKTSNKVSDCFFFCSFVLFFLTKFMVINLTKSGICISGNHIYFERTEESSVPT